MVRKSLIRALFVSLCVGSCGVDEVVPSTGADAADTADADVAGPAKDAEPILDSDSGLVLDAGELEPPVPDAGEEPPMECLRVRATVQETLNVRPDPSTSGAPVARLLAGQVVDVLQRVTGEIVEANDQWYEIQAGWFTGFITAVYAECTTDAAVFPPPAAYLVPLECGEEARIAQGNNGTFSHSGRARYAFDFAIPVGTPLTAMQDGTVHHIYDQTEPGDPCYDGGDSDCFPFANLVVLLHADGSTSIYKHLSAVQVALGDQVTRGTVLGLSGSSGYSTGPHAHVMRQEDCGQANCQSLPLVLYDVGGDGVPEQNDVVVSHNCP